MVAFFISAYHLLRTAIGEAVQGTSRTFLGIAVSAVVSLAFFIRRQWTSGNWHGLRPVKIDWAAIGFAVMVFGITWLLLVGGYAIYDVYSDHIRLTASNRELQKQISGPDGFLEQIKSLQKQLQNKADEYESLSKEAGDLRVQLLVDERFFKVHQEMPAVNKTPSAADASSAPIPRESSSGSPDKYVCTTIVTPISPDTYGVIVEFGMRKGSTSGFAGAVFIDQKITTHKSWGTGPLRTDIADQGGVYVSASNSIERDQIYRVSFSSPDISAHRSEYFYVGSDKPFNIKGILFLEDFNALSDPLKADQLAKSFSNCPR